MSTHHNFEPDLTPTTTLQDLSKKYQTKAQILDGINEHARINNQQVISVLKQTGEIFDQDPNNIFGIYLGGSRIQGYHTEASDVDLIIVRTDTHQLQTSHYHDTIRAAMSKTGLTNSPCGGIEISVHTKVPTNAENFISKIDDAPERWSDTFFGFTVYENPNLTLGRLAYLEIIRRNTSLNWELSQTFYANTYLGEYPLITQKIADRLQEPKEKVRSQLPESLFKARYRKFGLGEISTHYQKTLRWYKRNIKKLNRFIMKDVYEEVKTKLDNDE